VVFLDGAYRERDGELAFEQLAHLLTRDVGEVLEQAVRRMTRHLRRRTPSAALEPHAAEEPKGGGIGSRASRRTAVAAGAATSASRPARLRQGALRVARRLHPTRGDEGRSARHRK